MEYPQTTGRPSAANRVPIWLWLAPLLTCGLMWPVSLFVIAGRLQQARAWQGAGAIAAAALLGFGMAGSQPEGTDNNIITLTGLLLYLAAWVSAFAYVFVMGPRVPWNHVVETVVMRPTTYAPAPPPVHFAPPPDPNAAAIAQVELERHKRAEARALAQRDPQMARDLRIGRPDLPRQFDDGGLVDVNAASAAAFVRNLGMSPAQADQVLAARQQLGQFQHPDDLVNLGGLGLDTWEQVKDRIILL